MGSGECLDVVVAVLGHVESSESAAVVVVVVLQQAGSGECLAVVVVVVVPEAQFVEHKNKWEAVSALVWLSWCTQLDIGVVLRPLLRPLKTSLKTT